MQFDTGGSGSQLQSEINVTPLVDVVLVLLIIFMVVVPLLLQGYDVGMPRTSAEAPPAQVEAWQVVLRIDPTACRIIEPPAGEGIPADCRVTLAGHEIPAAELPARVAEALGARPAVASGCGEPSVFEPAQPISDKSMIEPTAMRTE